MNLETMVKVEEAKRKEQITNAVVLDDRVKEDEIPASHQESEEREETVKLT